MDSKQEVIQLVLEWISRDCVKKPWNGVLIEHMNILHCILHPFIRFSQRAVANSLLLIDLVILRCFLKLQCFSKCDPTETHLGQLIRIQIPQAPPNSASLNSLLNSMLIPLGARTAIFGIDFSRTISPLK